MLRRRSFVARRIMFVLTAPPRCEIASRVEASIQKMNDQDREIILMRHYEHLSNLEIAEVLGLNPPAASMRYLRAVRRLREMLQDDEFASPIAEEFES